MSPSDSRIPYSFLSFRQVRWVLGPRCRIQTSWRRQVMAVVTIYLLHLKLTILSVCDTLIHLEELPQLGVLLFPINASIAITSSSRARSGPLGACRSRFLLAEENKVMLEQFELGALRESTLPRHYLVIYFSEFLPTKESVRKGLIMVINK